MAAASSPHSERRRFVSGGASTERQLWQLSAARPRRSTFPFSTDFGNT